MYILRRVRLRDTRFPQYQVVRGREPASFWRENLVAVVILLRVSENVVMAETSYQMLEVLSFCDRERAEPPSI